MIIELVKDTFELDKIIRNQIIENLEIPKDRVANALSVRGASLSKLITDNVKLSLDLADIFIVFERSIDSSIDTISMDENDDSITNYSHFKYKIICYGNASDYILNKLYARLLSAENREKSISKGVFIREISNPQSANEFMNNTVWMRTDLEILISCRFNFSKVLINDDFEKENLTIKNINII